MTKILFLCHGNICRSPMAEFVLKDMAAKRGIADHFEIASAVVSREELGNPIYPPALRKMRAEGIGTPDNELGVNKKTARLTTRADYDHFDRIICMDQSNIRYALRIYGGDPDGKIRLMMGHRDVADPWYTGDFESTFRDVKAGCESLLEESLK